jgi:hypothetical protein
VPDNRQYEPDEPAGVAARVGRAVREHLAILQPQHWRQMAHQLSRAPGWTPPMVLIATLLSLVAGPAVFPGAALLHAIFAPAMIAISSFAIYLVAKRFGNVLYRYGPAGITRPRWWFEVGRALWIVCVASFATAIGGGMAGLLQPGPLANAAWGALTRLSGYSFVAFIVVATAAYLLSVARRMPRRGKAFECVQFFYGIILACALMTVPAVLIPRPNDVALVFLALAAVAALAATAIALATRVRNVSRAIPSSPGEARD